MSPSLSVAPETLSHHPPDRFAESDGAGGNLITIGLVNNMRGLGFGASERQFRALVTRATPPDRRTRLQLYTLHNDAAAAGAAGYGDLASLYRQPPDALIITGAEPQADDLREEKFWLAFTRLIDWATERDLPIIFSCLAAHAAVLHFSGIKRRRLPRKLSGVFTYAVPGRHRLVEGMGPTLISPHSRWNTVDEQCLADHGYDPLARSNEYGVDLFVSGARPFCTFLQGHPEYEAGSLVSEYTRDVRRYLKGDTSVFPGIPTGCFDAALTEALEEFEIRARDDVSADPAQIFWCLHEAGHETGGACFWRSNAELLYRNWLSMIVPGAASFAAAKA